MIIPNIEEKLDLGCSHVHLIDENSCLGYGVDILNYNISSLSSVLMEIENKAAAFNEAYNAFAAYSGIWLAASSNIISYGELWNQASSLVISSSGLWNKEFSVIYPEIVPLDRWYNYDPFKKRSTIKSFIRALETPALFWSNAAQTNSQLMFNSLSSTNTSILLSLASGISSFVPITSTSLSTLSALKNSLPSSLSALSALPFLSVIALSTLSALPLSSLYNLSIPPVNIFNLPTLSSNTLLALAQSTLSVSAARLSNLNTIYYTVSSTSRLSAISLSAINSSNLYFKSLFAISQSPLEIANRTADLNDLNQKATISTHNYRELYYQLSGTSLSSTSLTALNSCIESFSNFSLSSLLMRTPISVISLSATNLSSTLLFTSNSLARSLSTSSLSGLGLSALGLTILNTNSLELSTLNLSSLNILNNTLQGFSLPLSSSLSSFNVSVASFVTLSSLALSSLSVSNRRVAAYSLSAYKEGVYIEYDENRFAEFYLKNKIPDWLYYNFPPLSFAPGQTINLIIQMYQTTPVEFVFQENYLESCLGSGGTTTNCGECDPPFFQCNGKNGYDECIPVVDSKTNYFKCRGEGGALLELNYRETSSDTNVGRVVRHKYVLNNSKTLLQDPKTAWVFVN